MSKCFMGLVSCTLQIKLIWLEVAYNHVDLALNVKLAIVTFRDDVLGNLRILLHMTMILNYILLSNKN